ncbi:MAG: hypothetical protein WD267_07355 [Balneolales bacterium]
MNRTALFFLFLTMLGSNTIAQVTISPTTLFIDDQSRFGTFLVMNNSGEPQEVSLSFVFGYLGTDDTGSTVMQYDDEKAASQYSIADWIRGFPRNFILQPGQRQTIRLTVRPPGDLPDGLYWTRIKTTSNPQVADVGDVSAEQISAQINFRFEQVISGFYKKGNITTGVGFEELSVEKNGNMASVLAKLNRSGNSPFLGSVQLLVTDSAGKTLTEKRSSTTLYFDGLKRFDFNISEWPEGEYTAELKFESRRSDIPQTDLIQINPVSKKVKFTISP